MYDQAKYEPYESSELFDDGGAGRVHPEGTIARGRFDPDRAYTRGTTDGGAFITSLPERIEVTPAYMRRGEERYGIFCAPCHGALGYGDGMIVQRGYFKPASYHEARLQKMPVGYFFDVITQGFGRMPAYASQVPVEDRWAIVAYLRALQLSQSADVAALTGEAGEVARAALEDNTGDAALMGVGDDGGTAGHRESSATETATDTEAATDTETAAAADAATTRTEDGE